MLDIIIQIILALFLILIMGFIAYSIYDKEFIKSIKIYNTNKLETRIFKGVFPYNEKMAKVETFNRYDPYYLNLEPSVNQNGGAEYSYNFWLYFNLSKDDNDEATLIGDNTEKFIVLFYKGAKQLIPYNQYRYSCDTYNKDANNKSAYILVKNPLVKINNNCKELVIEYNNINTPDTYNSSSSPLNCDAMGDNYYNTNVNKLGIKNIDTRLYNKTYNMITIVMQESPTNEEAIFQNRTNCKVYFNGGLVSDRSTFNNDITDDLNSDNRSTVMKKNAGNLYINPGQGGIFSSPSNNPSLYNKELSTITDSDDITKDVRLKVADLSYFNYALTENEIYKLYDRGFNNNLADIITKNNETINKTLLIGKKVNFDINNNDFQAPVESI
jgi:hypothetical protein